MHGQNRHQTIDSWPAILLDGRIVVDAVTRIREQAGHVSDVRRVGVAAVRRVTRVCARVREIQSGYGGTCDVAHDLVSASSLAVVSMNGNSRRTVRCCTRWARCRDALRYCETSVNRG